MVEAIIGFVGVIFGALITYSGEWWLRRGREIRRHKNSLIKVQFILVNMINEIANIKLNYNQHRETENREFISPIFPTSVDWRLDRNLAFDIYYKGTKIEKELIIDCSFLDKEFRGLVGSIEDKIKYYERYGIDRYEMEGV